MNTIEELNPSKKNLLDLDYKFQPELTEKLDNDKSVFDQESLNEIVLWKTNRYAKLNTETLELINSIKTNAKKIDIPLTETILNKLLNTKGIRLPMASTILRFRNPNIYQIIDQRVYRVIYGHKLKLSSVLSRNISLYFNYLEKLRNVAEAFEIPFSESDRILYEYDKKVNKEKINY